MPRYINNFPEPVYFDQTVFIPMAGNLQSLNVSVATGMALYEACRQRQA